MTTIHIVLFSVVALLLGAGICFFVMNRRKDTGKIADKGLLEQKENLEKLLNESKSRIATLEERIGLLSNSKDVDPNVLNKFAEIDALKKKIKKLEEESEDFESDLEEARRKLKKKTDDCLVLDESCTKLEREIKELQDEVQTLKKDLSQKEENLKLKNESLNFVQEILSAKEFSSGDKNEIYHRVDSLKDFIAGELHDTIKIVGMDGEIDQYFFREGLTKWEILKKKDWIAGKTAIAFIGEFSAGKTSIVNRILSQDDPTVPQLPVSTKATTAIPTYISGGIKIEFEFFSHDNKLKKIEKSTFMRVNKEVLDEVGGVSNLIQYFVMEYKNEKLNQISILDTPGFSSNDSEDSKRTIEVINECDALFWVFDVNVGTVNRSSLKLMKEHLKKPLYVVINKVDTKTQKEVDDVEGLIRKTFVDEGVSIQGILKFSKKEPLADIMATIGSIKGASTQESFLNDLRDSVQKIATVIDADVTKQSQKHQECRHITESISTGIRGTIQSTKTACEHAVRIPHFNKANWLQSFVRDDRYEMSCAEYKELGSVLTDIDKAKMSSLKSLSDNLIDASKKEQAAHEAYKTASFNARRINEVLSKLRIKINELNSK